MFFPAYTRLPQSLLDADAVGVEPNRMASTTPTNTRFIFPAFERYFADTHTALATAIPGLQRFEAARAVATPDGSELPYQRIAELTFEDVEALQAGLRSEDGQAAVNDIPNFATGGVTIFFAQID